MEVKTQHDMREDAMGGQLRYSTREKQSFGEKTKRHLRAMVSPDTHQNRLQPFITKRKYYVLLYLSQPGYEPLHAAARAGDVLLSKYLLDTGTAIDSAKRMDLSSAHAVGLCEGSFNVHQAADSVRMSSN